MLTISKKSKSDDRRSLYIQRLFDIIIGKRRGRFREVMNPQEIKRLKIFLMLLMYKVKEPPLSTNILCAMLEADSESRERLSSKILTASQLQLVLTAIMARISSLKTKMHLMTIRI